MCGVAGVMNGAAIAEPVPFERLRRMAAILGHRGPDGYGFYRDRQLGFAHRRLSIIDLATGEQPLSNEDGTVWLCFNGEIFNYVELRRELAAAGHRFATQGDSEVIVHAYEEYGDAAWAKLNGQFAFGLWDTRQRRLWLVRDRVGILPLHYSVRDGRVVFGSEAKALFASGYVEPSWDPQSLSDVFTRWATTAPRTVFAGVQAVRPGTAVRFDADLAMSEIEWWSPALSADPATADLSLAEAADILGEHLSEAVRLRLRADVPVGAYLSGGLDSSVIGSLVEKGDSPLETFAVRFADLAFDETTEQRRMAKLLGTRHHEIVCGPDEIAAALRDVVWHAETPLLRTAPVPLFLLSGLVQDAGMKVVLTGEGADELLSGYGIFKEDAVRRFWARNPESTWRPALAERLHSEVQASGTRGTQMWSRFFGRRLTETDDPFYSHAIRWGNTAWAKRVLAPELRVDSVPPGLPDGFGAAPALARAQWIELDTFMSSYLLSHQGDRVAMAHSVEVRYPFLDPAVIDWCLRLPTRLKMPGLRDKVALRRLASRTLPPEIWARPKKPYRAPMTTALFGPDSPEYVQDLLSPSAVQAAGLLDPRAVELLSQRAFDRKGELAGEREEMALVGALSLQSLAQSYLVELDQRIDAAVRQLDQTQPSVLIDRVEVAA